MMIPAVDLSEFQGQIDADALAALGIQHAIVRCADPARQPPPDPYYQGNTGRCRQAGIPTDAYVFVRAAKGSPADEADRYTSWAETVDQPGRLWLDVEGGTEGPLWPEELADWLVNLVDELERLGWRDRLGIYTNDSYWRPHVAPTADVLGRLPLWVATYPYDASPGLPQDWEAFLGGAPQPVIPSPWRTVGWVGWQFSSSWDGIPGHRCDVNLFLPDFLQAKSKPLTQETSVGIWIPNWAQETTPGRVEHYELLADGHHLIAWNGAQLHDPGHPDQPHPGLLQGPDGLVLNLEDFYGPGPYGGVGGFGRPGDPSFCVVANGAACFKLPTGRTEPMPPVLAPSVDLPSISQYVRKDIATRI